MKKQLHPALVGFLQALGTILYILLIALFMNSMEPAQNEYINIILGLLLFITSATITGFLVLARPLYLAYKREIGEALKTLGFTVAFFLLTIILFIAL